MFLTLIANRRDILALRKLRGVPKMSLKTRLELWLLDKYLNRKLAKPLAFSSDAKVALKLLKKRL